MVKFRVLFSPRHSRATCCLGGTYLNRDYFDPQTSHLIVKKPARNEKFLASLASGKWILHTDYIEACKEAGAFVKVGHKF